ncbi:MAG: group 1 truncated hemoglobin [Zetaproteobacteria bacterium CG2_30_59_37]|nr:MAG: group 1 truncated hemoglobin [Zetaproteobacteria bacterium CG2_30_59_37]
MPEDTRAKPKAAASVYDQIGGTAAVDAAVDVFYRRVLADAYVNHFFQGVDMSKQAAKQKAFLTMVMGGPHNYTGKDMREGHKHLIKMGLNDSHFDHILMHLRATLAELGVPENLIQTIIGVAESTRDDVLDR